MLGGRYDYTHFTDVETEVRDLPKTKWRVNALIVMWFSFFGPRFHALLTIPQIVHHPVHLN